MHVRRVAAVIAALAAGHLAAGCGDSEEDRVRAEVEEFTAAVEARDSERICAALSPELFLGVPCDETILIFARPPNAAGGDVVAVEVEGETATAELERGSLTLEQVDGEWKVAELP